MFKWLKRLRHDVKLKLNDPRFTANVMDGGGAKR